MPIGLKRDRLLRDDRGEAIASATRTLQLEAEGLSALKAALAGDLVDGFAEALEIFAPAAAGSSSPAWARAAMSG